MKANRTRRCWYEWGENNNERARGILIFLLTAICVTASPARSQSAADHTLSLNAAMMRVNRLAPPGNLTGTAVFTVDDTATQVVIRIAASSGPLTTSVLAPNGTLLNESTIGGLGGGFHTYAALSPPPGDSLLILPAEPGFHYDYLFPSLGPGTYTVNLALPPGFPLEVAVITECTLKSPLATTLFSTEPVIPIGRTSVISAAAFAGAAPVVSASVTAAIKPPFSAEFPLALLDNGQDADAQAGDGLYSGQFMTVELGDYTILATISGTTAGGQAFSRDCNANGVPDECDLAAGTSNDCDGDGALDECQACFVLGDMNCDCALTVSDIGGFVTAVTSAPACEAYYAQFPGLQLRPGRCERRRSGDHQRHRPVREYAGMPVAPCACPRQRATLVRDGEVAAHACVGRRIRGLEPWWFEGWGPEQALRPADAAHRDVGRNILRWALLAVPTFSYSHSSPSGTGAERYPCVPGIAGGSGFGRGGESGRT